jgi:exo-1,4-beta-D-glucosaminidase
MYFVDLRLENGERLESRNFYWLPKQAETVDFENEPGSGVWTPTKTFADFTALNSLPVVDLDMKAEKKTEGERETMTVTLRNPSRTMAFGIRQKVKKTGRDASGVYWFVSHFDDEVLPSIWEDNYFVLLLGETRRIAATYNPKDLLGNAPAVEVSGWNVTTKEARP